MAKAKEWKEAELMLHFQLKKIANQHSSAMQEWLNTEPPAFDTLESLLFEAVYQNGFENMAFWSEGDLKMYFICNVLRLGNLMNMGDKNHVGLFGRKLKGTINQTKLSVRSDFLVAKGFKNITTKNYFHFQTYKPELNPTGEPMAQLLEALLIGQTENNKDTALYGCEVIGKQWTFVIMEGKTYCVSKTFDCTEREDLLKIIAVLRKFKEILETRLLVA